MRARDSSASLVSVAERSRICLLHGPKQGEADEPVQHDVPGWGERRAKFFDEPGGYKRSSASCQGQSDAVSKTHGCDPGAERENLDNHGALKPESHAERHGQEKLPEHKLQRCAKQ